MSAHEPMFLLRDQLQEFSTSPALQHGSGDPRRIAWCQSPRLNEQSAI